DLGAPRASPAFRKVPSGAIEVIVMVLRSERKIQGATTLMKEREPDHSLGGRNPPLPFRNSLSGVADIRLTRTCLKRPSAFLPPGRVHHGLADVIVTEHDVRLLPPGHGNGNVLAGHPQHGMI